MTDKKIEMVEYVRTERQKQEPRAKEKMVDCLDADGLVLDGIELEDDEAEDVYTDCTRQVVEGMCDKLLLSHQKTKVLTLYRQLINDELRFLPRGVVHIREIYLIVQHRYGKLCDDHYLCFQNCNGGMASPEWKHRVRGVLSRLSMHPERTGVRKHQDIGYWIFE